MQGVLRDDLLKWRKKLTQIIGTLKEFSDIANFFFFVSRVDIEFPEQFYFPDLNRQKLQQSFLPGNECTP